AVALEEAFRGAGERLAPRLHSHRLSRGCRVVGRAGRARTNRGVMRRPGRTLDRGRVQQVDVRRRRTALARLTKRNRPVTRGPVDLYQHRSCRVHVLLTADQFWLTSRYARVTL